MPRAELARRYSERFVKAVSVTPTPGQHVNVLQHMMGYFKDCLDEAAKKELRFAVDDYRRERVPLAVPIELLRRYARAHGVEYLARQIYLEPAPGVDAR